MAEKTELHIAKRRAIHALLDITYMIFAFVMAFLWASDGHNRDASILLAITYWGYPWPEHRYIAPRWRSARLDGGDHGD